MKRRKVIAALGAGSGTTLGGCSSVLGEDASVELLDVRLINWTDEPVSARVRVALDGETVDEGSYELGAESGRLLDCAWPSEPGRFAVAARLEGDDEWEERDVTDAESDCAVVRVMIEGAPDPPSLPISRDCERYDARC